MRPASCADRHFPTPIAPALTTPAQGGRRGGPPDLDAIWQEVEAILEEVQQAWQEELGGWAPQGGNWPAPQPPKEGGSTTGAPAANE